MSAKELGLYFAKEGMIGFKFGGGGRGIEVGRGLSGKIRFLSLICALKGLARAYLLYGLDQGCFLSFCGHRAVG